MIPRGSKGLQGGLEEAMWFVSALFRVPGQGRYRIHNDRPFLVAFLIKKQIRKVHVRPLKDRRGLKDFLRSIRHEAFSGRPDLSTSRWLNPRKALGSLMAVSCLCNGLNWTGIFLFLSWVSSERF